MAPQLKQAHLAVVCVVHAVQQGGREAAVKEVQEPPPPHDLDGDAHDLAEDVGEGHDSQQEVAAVPEPVVPRCDIAIACRVDVMDCC